MWRGKRALVRLRGRGGNRVKLVSVVERERPKQCTIVFVVELGGARIRDEDRGNMSDAIIPALKHRSTHIPNYQSTERESYERDEN